MSMKLTSINPATGETTKTYTEMTPAAAAQAIEQAHESWLLWRNTPFTERAGLMKRAGEILRRRKAELAQLMAIEMGKPRRQGIAEAEKCAWVCDYYADNAENHLSPEFIATDATKSYVAFEPLGVVLAVMPWNFPFWQVFRFAAPAPDGGQRGRA
jgi:succinate-semialdehyde dehydrogenase/glutarate-semialdehyde dehydrogenase